MAVPPAPLQRHAQDRADPRPPHRVGRWALRVLLLVGGAPRHRESRPGGGALGRRPAPARDRPGARATDARTPRTRPRASDGRLDREPHPRAARRDLPGAGDRRHRRADRAVLAGLERDRRRPEQHLRALAAAARTGDRRDRRDDRAARRVGGRQDAVRQLRDRRPVLGRAWPAVLRHDLADRQQRRRDGLRRGQVPGPRDDHRLPVGGGQQHPDLAAERRRQADQRPRQGHLLPLPGPRRDPRRDVAGLAGPDPQARDPDHRGHAVDGGRRHRRHRADRQARRLHRGRHHGRQRHDRGAQRGLLQAPRPDRQQLPAGAGGRPAERHEQLRLHLGQRPGRPERQRAVVGPGLQAVAVRGTRHDQLRPRPATARRPSSTPTAGSCCGRRRSRPTRPRAPR